MTSAFRERADAVDLNLRDARGSILRRYKQLLLQYDLEEFWRSRSVPSDWLSLVATRVTNRLLEERRTAAATSLSLAAYIRRSPDLSPLPWLADDSCVQGQWLKRRARTSTLPVLTVLHQWSALRASWVPHSLLCGCCGRERETLPHFLRCPSRSLERAHLLDRCQQALHPSDRDLVVATLSGADHTAADDVLLGASRIGGRALRVDTVRSLHGLCCNFLLVCWKSRARTLGGVPSLSSDGSLIFQPRLWCAFFL